MFKFYFTLLSVLMFGVLTANTQNPRRIAPERHEGTDQVSVSADYYRQFSFTWIDDAGVEHESNLTDRATDSNHIIALLKEVYTNPEIPGYREDAAYNSNDPWNGPDERNGLERNPLTQYAPCSQAPYNMDPSMPIQAPLNGATALLVELRDDFGSAETGTSSGTASHEVSFEMIKAVSIMPNQMYIGATEQGARNPGFVFNLRSVLNKYFIITKGNNRQTHMVKNDDGTIGFLGAQPFYGMFEEFSPSNDGSNPMNDAYAMMNAGERFPVDHNCSSVLGQRHDIQMSPAGEVRHYNTNLLFYLPDNRFAGDSRVSDRSSYKGEHYSFYNKEYAPYVFFNYIHASIPSTPAPAPDNDSQVLVTVKWVTPLKDILRQQDAEEFYISRVVDGVAEANPIPASELVISQEGTTVRPDGLINRAASSDVWIQVREDKFEGSRDVQYVVYGRRSGSRFDFCVSNIVETEIPGSSDLSLFGLEISAEGGMVSVYDINSEENRYDNNIAVVTRSDDSSDRLLCGHVTEGTRFNLVRYEDGAISSGTIVGTLTITGATLKSWGSLGTVVYSGRINYADERGEQPVNDKQFKSPNINVSAGMTLADALQVVSSMPLCGIDVHPAQLMSFNDIFAVSTARNSHAASYQYLVEMLTPRSEGEDLRVSSNILPVSIPKRNLYAGYFPYTQEQIRADYEISSRLKVNRPGVAVTASDNKLVASYDIIDTASGIVVARAERIPELSAYKQLTFSDEGLRQTGVTDGNFTGRLPLELPDNAVPGSTYALVVRYVNGNTYGAMQPTLVAPPTVYAEGSIVRENNGSEESTPVHSYISKIHWAAEGMTVNPYGALADEEAGQLSFSDCDANAGYTVWTKVENVNDDYTVSRYVGESVSYAALEPDDTETDDFRSLNHQFRAEGNSVGVNHVLRMYALMPSDLAITSDPAKPGYIIADTDARLQLGSGPATGIDDVEVSDNLPAVYFNLAGQRVNDITRVPAGVYIEHRGNESRKVVINN